MTRKISRSGLTHTWTDSINWPLNLCYQPKTANSMKFVFLVKGYQVANTYCIIVKTRRPYAKFPIEITISL